MPCTLSFVALGIGSGVAAQFGIGHRLARAWPGHPREANLPVPRLVGGRAKPGQDIRTKEMQEGSAILSEMRIPLVPLDQLSVDIVTDDVSDNYVSKTLFAVSEFANIVRAGAKTLSGEALLCANLGFGCRLTSNAGGIRHAMLFDTGPEGAIFLRNCANLGIALSGIECIAVSHGHWDHMAALPATLDAIREQGGTATVHVNPGMFNERAVRLGERHDRPGHQGAITGRNVGPGCGGRQRSGRAPAARQSLLL